MELWMLILIVVTIASIVLLTLKETIAKKSSTEIMVFGIVILLTGGILSIAPNLSNVKNFFYVNYSIGEIIIPSVGYSFILLGFLIGIIGFFKQ